MAFGSALAPPLVVSGGNFGASKTFDVQGRYNVWMTGTLNANCAVTTQNKVVGGIMEILAVQDGTGNWTLTVDTQLLNIPSLANSPIRVTLLWTGDLWIDVASGGFVNPMSTVGDIIVGGASGSPTRVAKGGNNTTFGVDGSGTLGYKADPTGGGLSYTDRHTRAFLFEDFFAIPSTGGYGFITSVSGAGAAASGVGVTATNRPGVAQLATGTTATGRAGISTTTSAIICSAGAIVYEAGIQFPIASDGTETFQIAIGLIDSTSALSTDGVFFVYDSQGVLAGSTASANWQTVGASSGTLVWNTSSTAVAINAWITLRIEVAADGSLATFYVNGTSIGTTTTIPAANVNRATGSGTMILKSAGTTTRVILLDYIATQIDFTTARA